MTIKSLFSPSFIYSLSMLRITSFCQLIPVMMKFALVLLKALKSLKEFSLFTDAVSTNHAFPIGIALS